jgi:putative glycosyltransferase (TIGR04372 family)
MKNLIDKILKIIFFPFSFFFIFIQLICYKLLLIRVGFIPSHRIGHLAGDMEIYLNKKNKLKKKKEVDIFFSTKIISNKTLYFLIKKEILIFPQYFFSIYQLLIFFKKFFSLFDQFIINLTWHDTSGKIGESYVINIKPPIDFYKKGDLFLKKIGISENDKIVCLNIRDNEYLKYKFPEKNWDYHRYRDSDVKNYFLTINELIKRGFYIFRMGEKVEKKIHLNSPNFIDYANKYRTDFLDIYLASRCNFVISTGTGWDSVPAFIFKKPIAYVNICPLISVLAISFSKFFFVSFKEYQDNFTKKKLNIKNLSEKKILSANSFSEFKKNNINIIENSPQDIYNVVIELLNFLEGKNVCNSKANKKLFWKNFLKYSIDSELMLKYKPRANISSDLLNRIKYFYNFKY